MNAHFIETLTKSGDKIIPSINSDLCTTLHRNLNLKQIKHCWHKETSFFQKNRKACKEVSNNNFDDEFGEIKDTIKEEGAKEIP